ncbi:unnamed protein product [Mycena citricolor]|uniref:HMG box domain-containing protein n=1 Tax=Mycena citricolor TaxID=2018698 RepID=A0AAD2Q3N8_9AGAR|nr:unnamed protein product [Mycena citricolor]
MPSPSLRSPNAFILFRSFFSKNHSPPNAAQAHVSALAGQAWRGLADAERAVWQERAAELKRAWMRASEKRALEEGAEPLPRKRGHHHPSQHPPAVQRLDHSAGPSVSEGRFDDTARRNAPVPGIYTLADHAALPAPTPELLLANYYRSQEFSECWNSFVNEFCNATHVDHQDQESSPDILDYNALCDWTADYHGPPSRSEQQRTTSGVQSGDRRYAPY